MAKTKPIAFPDCVQALSQVEADFLGRKGVQGLAVGVRTVNGKETGELCVKVYVRKKQDRAQLSDQEALPSHITLPDGRFVPVDLEEMAPLWAGGGPVCALQGSSRAQMPYRVRPAMGGYSVGHYLSTAGTIALAVRDSHSPSVFYILSNNHVLAQSNDAEFADPILQPGPADGGRCASDTIAYLCRCVAINFGAGSSNLVDAAIACVAFGDTERRVYGIGYPRAVRGHAGLQLGELVQKTGRTTGYTQGRIIGLEGTVTVNYSRGRAAQFHRQIITSNMSAGGDSGSVGLDMNGNALGLLFAGSGSHTIFNYIDEVQTQLGIVVAEQTI